MPIKKTIKRDKSGEGVPIFTRIPPEQYERLAPYLERWKLKGVVTEALDLWLDKQEGKPPRAEAVRKRKEASDE